FARCAASRSRSASATSSARFRRATPAASSSSSAPRAAGTRTCRRRAIATPATPKSTRSVSMACVFCEIVAGNAPASFVHRDDRCVAFMDIRPVNRGHMLVVPRVHAQLIGELGADESVHLMRVAHGLAAKLRTSGLRCEGVNLFLADGEAAGQEVFHVHLHVLPRFRGDGFGLRLPPNYRVLPREELESDAALLRR